MNTKKFKLSLVCMLFFLLLVPSRISLADELQNLTTYDIKVTLNDEEKTLTASETVNFTNNYDSELSELIFHLYPDSYNTKDTLPAIGYKPDEALTEEQTGDIDINYVLIDGKKIAFTEENQLLKLPLNKSLKKGESIKVTITFTLKLPHGVHRLGYYENQYSLTNWYPILSVYDDKTKTWDENPYHPIGESNYSHSSNYKVSVNVPKDMVVVSTGVTKNTIPYKNIKKVIIEANKVRDFVIMMNKDYKVITKNVNGIKVNSYYIGPKKKTKDVKTKKTVVKDDNVINHIKSEAQYIDNKPTAERMLNFASDSLQFYSETFGEYPFKEFDVVESYLGGGAMEYPQLIQMGKYYSSRLKNNEERLTWNDEAVVHETCHQWWYSLVGNNEYTEPILDESLTVFSTALYFEKKYGEFNEKGVKMALSRYLPSTDSPINSSVDAFKEWSDYSRTIYRKGPAIFVDLRKKLGEEAFLELLKEYFNTFKYKNATVEGLLNVIEAKAGKEIRDYTADAISSTDYNPKNILLTEEERKKVQAQQIIKNYEEMEQYFGNSISSIFLKGAKGETIYVVKPSKTADKQEGASKENTENSDKKSNDASIYNEIAKKYGLLKSPLEQSISNLTRQFDEMNIKYEILEDKKVSEEIKSNGTMILLGDTSNNIIIKDFKDKFPIKLNDDKISLDCMTINTENVSGIFTTSNPNNEDKLMLVLFGDYVYNNSILYFDEVAPEYMLKINDKIKINGRF